MEKKRQGVKKKRNRKGRGERAQQRNEMQGTVCTEGGGRGTERIPTGITSVRVFMSALDSSEAFGKDAYLLPIRIL